MIPKGLFTQIGMIIISIAIVMVYIKPELVEIGEVQSEIDTYQRGLAGVDKVNQKLSSLVTTLNTQIPGDDETRLLTYLPNEDSFDEVAVQRDLLLISKEAGVSYIDSSTDEEGDSRSSGNLDDKDAGPVPHSFSLSVNGSYESVKNLFALLQQNNYPLEVRSVKITGEEGDFMSVDITMWVYSYLASDLRI